MIQTSEETRRHSRARLSSDEPGATVQQGANVLWFYAMCRLVTLLVAVFCFTVGSDSWLIVGVSASIATVVAGAALVAMLVTRQRAASVLRRVRTARDTFEMRMPPAQLRALGDSLTHAGVRLLFDRPQQG